MPKFSDERKAEIDAAVKREVLDAVLRLLKRWHSAKITIGMLAEESGISKGTLYNYFANKDEIIAYAIEKSFEPMYNVHAQIIASDTGVLDKLRALTEASFGRDAELLNLMSRMANELSASNIRRPVEVLNSLRRSAMARIENVLFDGVRQGLFRDIGMQYLVAAFFGVKMGCEMGRVHAPENARCSVSADAERVIDVLLHGTAARRQRVTPGPVRDYSVRLGEGTKERVCGAVMSAILGCQIDRLSSDSISMNTLAVRAGVSKSALYKHFKSKDDLLAYAAKKVFEPHESAIREIVGSDMSVVKKLVAFAEARMNRSEATEKIYYIADIGQTQSSLKKVIRYSLESSNEWLGDIMLRGIDEGLLRRRGTDDLVLCFNGIIMVYRGYREYYTKKQFVAEDSAGVVDVFLNGVAKGAKRPGARRRG